MYVVEVTHVSPVLGDVLNVAMDDVFKVRPLFPQATGDLGLVFDLPRGSFAIRVVPQEQ